MSGWQNTWQDNSWDQWCHGGWHGNWWQEGWQDNSWDQWPAPDWSDWTPGAATAAVAGLGNAAPVAGVGHGAAVAGVGNAAAVTGVGNAAAVAGVGNAAAVAEPQLLQEAEPAKRGGKSHEVSFWKAWSHIARWREQEVDALKAALKQATFCHWRISTLERPSEAIYCTCCEQWLCDRYWYEEHKAGKRHKKNSRSRGMVMLMSAAAWVSLTPNPSKT